MNVSGRWVSAAALGAGLFVGWFARDLFSGKPSTLQLNDDAPAVIVNGRAWAFSDFPAELRNRIHTVFLQSNEQFRIAVEDFAARVSLSGGRVDEFDWEKQVKSRIDEKALRALYDNALGFKNKGSFDSPDVRNALLTFAIDRERSVMISEEIQKLKKDNKMQIQWSLPLGIKLQEDLSLYPTIEVGPAGKSIGGTTEVMFSYIQPYSDSAFNLLYRLATDQGQRLKVRLLTEYRGTEREKNAIAKIYCVASGNFTSDEIFSVHLRLLQDVPSFKAGQTQVDWKQAFQGNSDLAARVDACESKPLAEDVLLSNTKRWQALRQNPLPIFFADSRRISEYDPRGIEGVIRLSLRR